MTTCHRLTTDFFSDHEIPAWAANSEVVTRDQGLDTWGEFGYECHQLIRNGREIGWVYDTGTGYEWCEGQRPQEYGEYERGERWEQGEA